jgi:hypothetical protein
VRGIATIVGLVCVAAALWLAFMTFMDVAMIGFPDGYVTDYEKAVATPLSIAMWVEVGLAILFLALAFSPIRARVRTIGLLAALIAFVAVAFVAQAGVPWYYGTHVGLDNGIGG